MSTSTVDLDHPQPVTAVYELRDAAIEHGKAIAVLDAAPTAAARDDVLTTRTVLEAKTVAAMDECSENAEEAVAEALDDAQP